jgi:hypothetical protein
MRCKDVEGNDKTGPLRRYAKINERKPDHKRKAKEE